MAAAAVHRYHHIPKPPEGSERWICFYPAFINKDKTIAEGRRIPKEKAVSAPTSKEIVEVLSAAGLQICFENKIYCREQSKEPANWGRVKVQIKKDGNVVNPQFGSRDDVFLYVAEKIPTLKSRTDPPKPAGEKGQNQGKGKKKR